MRVVISAGELSGDEHGAMLVEALRRMVPDLELRGMGLRNLRAAGLQFVADAEKTGGVMGITEVFGGLHRAFSALSAMKRLVRSWKPDAVVIINYSEFNLALARAAKKAGCKVLFYIPPQVWAWRAGRVKAIDAYCDSVVTIFPFERAFYEQRGCNKVTYVGHPFVDHFKSRLISSDRKTELLGQAGLNPSEPIVALFPGSRRKEILHHVPFVREVFQQLKQKLPHVQGLLVSASPEWCEEIASHFTEFNSIRVVSGDSVAWMQCAHVGLVKSGTSNLQAVFCNLPFTMFYRVSRMTARLLTRFAPHMKNFSIVNILRPQSVREIVGVELDSHAAAEDLKKILTEDSYREQILNSFSEIRSSLSSPDVHELFESTDTAAERVARIVKNLAEKS